MLSIVATLYKSEQYIEEFCSRTTCMAQAMAGDDYEIVLVDDGSPDKSLDVAIKLAQLDRHLVVVELSRNFGHHKAMMTGLSYARGNYTFLIDVDLEEAPEWLAPFHEKMLTEECDVVYGVQRKRRGGWFERVSGAASYSLLRSMMGLDFPRNITTARLMTRNYVQALLEHREREVMLAGLWLITGFRQREFVVDKLSSSPTTYTLRRKISALVNGITSFSNVPLKLIFFLGAFISLFSILFLLFLVIKWIMMSTPISGWTSLITSIWFLGGATILSIGIQGIYISKIFTETKNRPYTIVRDVYTQDSLANRLGHAKDQGSK